MTHRAPAAEEEAPPPPKPKRTNLFAEKYLPHWAMLILTVIYVGLNLKMGAAAVPGTLHQGWSGTLGLWFGFLINQRAKEEFLVNTRRAKSEMLQEQKDKEDND